MGMELFPFFEAVLDPEDSIPMRIPDDHAGRTAVFTSPFAVDIPFSSQWDSTTASSPQIAGIPINGYSEVIIAPGTANSIYHTAGADQVVWTAGGLSLVSRHSMIPCLTTHPESPDANQNVVQGFRGWHTQNAQADRAALLPKLGADGHAWYECIFDNFADEGSVDVIVSARCNLLRGGNAVLTMTVRSASGELHSIATDIGQTGEVLFAFDVSNAVDPTSITGFYMTIAEVDPAAHWVFSFRQTQQAGSQWDLTLPAHSPCNFKIVDTPELDLLSETQSERTSALSGLLTYMGSDLANGGQVAAARLGMGLSPLRAPNGDVFTYLASLPFYNGDFPLRDGIYSWWLPDSIQEHFYVPYRSPRSDDLEFNSVLQYVALRDDPTQALRLRVVQNIEVITRSRLYSSVPAPINPAYNALIGAMKTLPAVTINNKHKGILRRALGSLRSWLVKPQNWRKMARMGAGVISKLAPGPLSGFLKDLSREL
jgi:hypothetical protein